MSPEIHPLLKTIASTDIVPATGWFRVLHNSFLARFPEYIADEVPISEEWKEIADLLEGEPDPASSPELLEQIEAHAWQIGYLGLRSLCDRVWVSLSPETKLRILAGSSEHLGDDLVHDWILGRLEDGPFDGEPEVEIGCNAIYFEGFHVLESILNRCLPYLEHRLDRIGLSGRAGEQWRQHLEPLSNRLIDIWFEAAVRMKRHSAIRLCLRHGANPNAPIWLLERSYNQRHSTLSYLLSRGGSQDGTIHEPTRQLIEDLLDAGADPQGTDYEGRNMPLAIVFGRRDWDMVEFLLDRGAKFEGGNFRVPQETAGCDSVILSPHPSLRIRREDSDWAVETLGKRIDFAEIGSVPYFYHGNAQGGYYSSFFEPLFDDDDVDRLRHFEARGLSTKLTVAVLLSAIHAGAYHCLRYLLRDTGDPDAVFKQIFVFKPDFGTDRRQYMCRLEPDGSNVIPDFNTHGQTPIEMPDGSRFYVHLDSIAAPGHEHGPVPEGSLFVQIVDAEHRRYGDELATTHLRKRWRLVPTPETDRQHFWRKAIEDRLPVVKESEGQFFWIGIDLSAFLWMKMPETWKAAFTAWEDGPEGEAVLALAVERVRQQDEFNERTPTPALGPDELDGYPREFWPYLVRLENGHVGMTGDSVVTNPGVLDLYQVWEKQNKPDYDVLPEPRILESKRWEATPEEFRPYLTWDETLKIVRWKMGPELPNDYQRAMARKAGQGELGEIISALRKDEATDEEP